MLNKSQGQSESIKSSYFHPAKFWKQFVQARMYANSNTVFCLFLCSFAWLVVLGVCLFGVFFCLFVCLFVLFCFVSFCLLTRLVKQQLFHLTTNFSILNHINVFIVSNFILIIWELYEKINPTDFAFRWSCDPQRKWFRMVGIHYESTYGRYERTRSNCLCLIPNTKNCCKAKQTGGETAVRTDEQGQLQRSLCSSYRSRRKQQKNSIGVIRLNCFNPIPNFVMISSELSEQYVKQVFQSSKLVTFDKHQVHWKCMQLYWSTDLKSLVGGRGVRSNVCQKFPF